MLNVLTPRGTGKTRRSQTLRQDSFSVPPSDQLLDEIASTIREMSASATRAFVMHAGRVVTEKLYDGSPTAWRFRGAKQHSLRRLAARPGLGVSPATLYRTLAAYEILCHAGSMFRWPELSVSHLSVVSKLPPGDSTALLDRAERESWSVSRLDEEAGRIDARGALRRGRSTSGGGRLRKLYQNVSRVRSLMRSQARERVEPTERAALLRALCEIEICCTEIRKRLDGDVGETEAPDVPEAGGSAPGRSSSILPPT